MEFLVLKFREFKISLFSIIFLITLESFYSYYLSLNVAYILTLMILILEAFSKIDKVNKKNFKLPNIFFSFFFIIFFLSIISFIYYKPTIADEYLEYKFFIKVIYALIFIYCLGISTSNENLKNILSIIILIHALLLIIQFISFYIFFVQIDFFNIFWGLEQKGSHLPFDINSKNFIDLKRFSGLFNEPGTYCNVVGILICLLTNLKSLNKFNKIVFFISSLSLLLTFSVYGYLYFVLVSISYLCNCNIKSYKKYFKNFKFDFKKFILNFKKKLILNILALILIIITLCILLNYSLPYFKSRFLDYSYVSGLELRFSAVIKYFNFILEDWFLLVIGKGMINESYAYYQTSITHDSSLFLYLLARSGIFIFFISFILSLYFWKFDKSRLCTFIIVMTSKLSLFSPIILFTLFILFLNFNEKK